MMLMSKSPRQTNITEKNLLQKNKLEANKLGNLKPIESFGPKRRKNFWRNVFNAQYSEDAQKGEMTSSGNFLVQTTPKRETSWSVGIARGTRRGPKAHRWDGGFYGEETETRGAWRRASRRIGVVSNFHHIFCVSRDLKTAEFFADRLVILCINRGRQNRLAPISSSHRELRAKGINTDSVDTSTKKPRGQFDRNMNPKCLEGNDAIVVKSDVSSFRSLARTADAKRKRHANRHPAGFQTVM
ncbi:hypothetical protein Tco_1069999 [Tanacetum coccineum]|uniref:Uncharacterized protein n=1 Tax=Tanacetum coccineum TaxID=301880 RepID=A0ABQ5HLZ1_9ASTR